MRYGPQNVGGVINFVDPRYSKRIRRHGQRADSGRQPRWPEDANQRGPWGGTADNGFGAELLYSGLHGQGYRESNDNTDIG
ncbi:Iron(III) dicitrate transport protein FecA [Cedecea neteri]|uniref:Iron(III) dicitrate transport protein FecA n=1 Tax=Cedecea neteri TaxID=158822 RepID=A0A2X3J5K2_9ENTR|nr:Iron(III) dicitrate transport protein FecA [Cedecea neteri]